MFFPLSTHQVLLHYELNHHASVLPSAKTVWNLGTDTLMHLSPTCNWLLWNPRLLHASHNRPQLLSAVFHSTPVCPPTHSSHTEAYPFYEAGFSKYFTVPKDDVSTFGTNSQRTGVCWVPFQTCYSPVKGTCSSKKAVWWKRTQKSQLQSLLKRWRELGLLQASLRFSEQEMLTISNCH